MSVMKPLLQSRTMWTAGLIIATGLSSAATAVVPVVGVLQGVTDPYTYLIWVAGMSGLSSVLGGIVMWLRVLDSHNQPPQP